MKKGVKGIIGNKLIVILLSFAIGYMLADIYIGYNDTVSEVEELEVELMDTKEDLQEARHMLDLIQASNEGQDYIDAMDE